MIYKSDYNFKKNCKQLTEFRIWSDIVKFIGLIQSLINHRYLLTDFGVYKRF